MSGECTTNIQDILESVKIPSHPPNKSQWKKLELAVKFINISKSSAAARRASMKMEPKLCFHTNKTSGETCKKSLCREEYLDEKSCHKVGKKSSRWLKVSKSLNTIA